MTESMELWFIAAMATGGTLFAVGGTTNKAWRRFALPGVLGLLLTQFFTTSKMAWLSVLLLCIALHLGYGEKKSWIERSLVAVSYTAPSLLIGFTPWAIITPILFITLFFLSNTEYFKNFIVWKIVEFMVGVLIAITYVMACQ